ncbi:chemotaxis protein CheX [Alkaliphilus serpentinus]|uniref:Chemotaxis protein CheX n=1 Tax=Alkaliphilus serpentinus TaxID=1482731 RepID=A0A833HR22_9FIRM|nr:chemotaxis protein CheX [Alkaliphilus serpentinus]KAB3531521.1 chemotaxis protein CheX [Alkaliphilus serpentinus]
MDVKYINPFMESFFFVMPQLGFQNPIKRNIRVINQIDSAKINISLGIIGDIRGNVIYTMNQETGKRIASQMMMGMPVEDFNEMAQSAISELTNMLTANASIIFANNGTNINISPPTLFYGEEIHVKTKTQNIISIGLSVGDLDIDINVALNVL